MLTEAARQLWARKLLGRPRGHSELEAKLAFSSMSTKAHSLPGRNEHILSLKEHSKEMSTFSPGKSGEKMGCLQRVHLRLERPYDDERVEYKKRICNAQQKGPRRNSAAFCSKVSRNVLHLLSRQRLRIQIFDRKDGFRHQPKRGLMAVSTPSRKLVHLARVIQELRIVKGTLKLCF